ncbi:MAG TPA: glycosyltransferase [Gemmatimonadaceae bacterium]
MMFRAKPPRWTVSVLTIPQREPYLAKLLDSLGSQKFRHPWELQVVYNWDTSEEPYAVQRRLKKLAKGLPLEVHFNTQQPTIVGGRMQQLALCKSPLICFLDDDLTLHGDVFAVIEEAMRELPLGIVGLPSLVGDTKKLFKPRKGTPYVDAHGVRFMQVQGMLIAGYRRLFRDIGGFNPRRTFWGEWTEMNLRMWRNGFPSAYVMDGAYLRHWEDAPESPTRNKAGREDHVLWGLLCTALEYDAGECRPDTESFWKLVENRYLAYSFGIDATPRQLLASVLRLVPRLATEWPHINAFREMTRQHPFQFAPFHALEPSEVEDVLRYAEEHIAPYRVPVFGSEARRSGRWLKRAVETVTTRARRAAG